MIVRHLGTGGGDGGKQGGFADVRKSHEAHVGQQLQLQPGIEALAGKTGLGKAGRLPGRGGKVGVSPAAAAAAADEHRLVAGDIRHQGAGVLILDEGTAGYTDGHIRAVAAKAVHAGAGLAVLRSVLFLITEVHQGGQIVIRDKINAAAAAAVAAVGSAGGNVLLPAEGNGTVAAVSRFEMDVRNIHEHGHGKSLQT